MKIKVTDIDGVDYYIDKPVQIIFIQTVGAACDALSVTFNSDTFTAEIVAVRAYDGTQTIFNGYCDNQRITEDSQSRQVYFYARSSACILLDSQAMPFTYNKPTANQLCFSFAETYGFKNGLPEIYSEDKYEVEKGVSCYGAINNFVSLLTGSEVYVTPDNELRLLRPSGGIKTINAYDVISATAVTNRSEPIYEISYKREASSGYILHTSSSMGKKIGIGRKQYVNLSALAQWQRDYTIAKRLRDSYSDYKILEIKVNGFVADGLYQRFDYTGAGEVYHDYVLAEKKYTFDSRGGFTRLILKKVFDVKEITYVD